MCGLRNEPSVRKVWKPCSFNLHDLLDLHGVGEHIEKSLYQLKSKSLSRVKAKKSFIRKMSVCRKNYPVEMFWHLCKCISSVVTTINDSYFVKSPTLTCLEKKVELMCDREEGAIKEPVNVRVKRVKRESGTFDGVIRMYDSETVVFYLFNVKLYCSIGNLRWGGAEKRPGYGSRF